MSHDVKIKGYTVAQRPNPPLLIAFAGMIAALIASDGSTFYEYSRGVFYMGLTVWAYLELVDGVNNLRRLLGAGGLIYILVRIGESLG